MNSSRLKDHGINYLSGSELLKWSGFGSHMNLRGKFKREKLSHVSVQYDWAEGVSFLLHVHISSITSAH